MGMVKIPKERIGVLIGEEGTTKEMIESKSGAELEIDSQTGNVDVDTRGVDDPILGMKVEDIVKAIGRGFSPRKAVKILKDDYYFELFDIKSYVGKSSKSVRRMKARLIGTNGRTRELIEELSGAYVSVYGKTVGIIGRTYEMNTARRAVEMILSGAEHKTVYSFLEGSRRELKRQKGDWY